MASLENWIWSLHNGRIMLISSVFTLKGACPEIFGKQILVQLADMVWSLFRPIHYPMRKKYKSVSDFQAIWENNVYVTYCFINLCGNHIFHFLRGFFPDFLLNFTEVCGCPFTHKAFYMYIKLNVWYLNFHIFEKSWGMRLGIRYIPSSNSGSHLLIGWTRETITNYFKF